MRVVATAGHVDHGKSSLVQALTGVNPDRFEEERRRGLTIDLGFAHTSLGGGNDVSFIDVPGHVRFLRNMLAGVGGVDACMFVIAATEGWKPQSEEHLRILQLLGLGHGIVALTKIDLVADDWRELQELDIRDNLAGTFLADRFVKGNCPKCDSPDQYGDSCDKCFSTYSAMELKNPRSTLSGAVPELREMLDLSVFVDQSQDVRLSRRITRDIRQRGRSRADVLDQFNATTGPMHAEYVEPSRAFADVLVRGDSSARAEVAALAGRLKSMMDAIGP